MTSELVEFVLEETTRPIDRWAVAATLESGGIRDLDARERFGKRDVFDLADEVYAQCLDRDPAGVRPAPDEIEPHRALATARRYLRGGFFFLQLALQLGSLAVLGYSQWASLEFSSRQASVVGIALLASFLLTGPAVQATGYLGPSFTESGKHLLAARVVAAMVGIGLATLLVGAVAWWAINLVADSYDNRSLGVALVYYVLAGCIVLTGAALYVLKQFTAMFVATVAGIAVVGLVLHRTSLGIYGAHWIGLSVSIVIEATWAAVVLARRAARTSPDLRTAVRPPLPLLVSLAAPHGLYGIGYFALLFADRLAAWSTDPHGLPFTFRAPYEVGLDWALISVVPGLALLEVTIYEFSRLLGSAGDRFHAVDTRAYRRVLLRFYRRQLALVGILLAVGTAVAFGGLKLAAHLHATKISDLFSDPTTGHVYVLGLAGYALLVLGLFNGLFLFSLNRPWLVLQALAPAVVVAVVVAFVLSRTIVYWAAAGGLVAGAFVYAILSGRNALRLLAAVDYHYFAAY